jgi:DNA-binding cell septation regulator SpoVG
MSASSTDAAGRGTSPVTVTEIKLRFVEDGRDGLIAWASCLLNGTVVLNNIAVRRGREGGLILTYPAKQTTAGTRFYYFNPISSDAAAVLDAAILGKVRDLLGARADQRAHGME